MSSIRLFNFFSKRTATGEGGLITGTNPAAFTSADPLRLWIIQVGIIIVMAQLLSLGLRRLRQPKVIAEVLGGILLGPTAFGRIPGFTQHIFPAVSLPYLSLVANIGLCLFLFLVGLEIDMSVVARNARMSIIVSLAGIALPFGLGTLLSIPLYHHFINPSVQFTHFMLFTGVAYSITAFPVLCRILTELKLLDTNVGIIVLSAGVGNDIVGWTLLALSVALVNAGSGLSALYILLVCVAFTLFLLMPVKYVMHLLALKTGSIENGPTTLYMTIVMLLVWASAFFTDSIGVNAIFGAFLAGLVVPREGGLAITLTEKLEDMVTIVFLPLYFTLSGLNTDLGLLNDGITWAFTIAIIALSFTGKFGGCAIASRLAGYGWREAGTVGALMSCKGLVELIVLNVGLQAGILSQRVFSMFILEALTLTCLTTPLVMALYPSERHVHVGEAARPGEGGEHGRLDEDVSVVDEEHPWRHRFTVVLDKLDHIPGAMALTQLFALPPIPRSDVTPTSSRTDTNDKLKTPEVTVDALQLIELSDRTSAMMKSSAADSLIYTDPILGIFRMFGDLHELTVTTSLSVVPYDDFAHSVAEHAHKHASHLILLPWLPPVAPSAADTSDMPGAGTTPKIKSDHNPFDVLFGSVGANKTDKPSSPTDLHSQFVRGVFSQSKTDVALFIDTGAHIGGPLHVFLPFFGGPDDRLALAFVVQLCLNPRMSATVMRMVKRDVGDLADDLASPALAHLQDKPETGSGALPLPIPRSDRHAVTTANGSPDTIYDRPTTETYLRSDTLDEVAWSKYATLASESGTVSPVAGDTASLRQALARVRFEDAPSTAMPLHAALCQARALRETVPRLLVVVGRSRRLARVSHQVEMKRLVETYRPSVGVEGIRRTIGDVGTAMVIGGSPSAVVVLQAAAV